MDAGQPGQQHQSAFGKIPVLVLDDNTVLFDSRVIVEYLDNVAPNNKLMPAPNRERSEVKRWEALADGVYDAAALVFREEADPLPCKVQNGSPSENKILLSLDFMSNMNWRKRLGHGNTFHSPT